MHDARGYGDKSSSINTYEDDASAEGQPLLTPMRHTHNADTNGTTRVVSSEDLEETMNRDVRKYTLNSPRLSSSQILAVTCSFISCTL